MSHVVSVKTAFKNLEVLKKAAAKQSVPCEVAAKGKTLSRTLYQGAVEGVAALQLKGWRYPAMVQDDGTCKADNYNGSWGKQSEMDALSQEYGKELATQTLRKQGYRVQSQKVEQDGTVELVFVS